MLNLTTLLADVYADKSAPAMVEVIKKYGLYDPLKRTVIQLNNLIVKEPELLKSTTILPVGHIAANLLTTINQRIVAEESNERKKEMEITMSAVCIRIIKAFLHEIKQGKPHVILQISHALKDTCDFYNFDYSELTQLVNINAELSFIQASKSGESIVLKKVPCFFFKKKGIDKESLLQIFKEQKLVSSKKGLSDLFGSPGGPLNLNFDPRHADIALQFFYTLKLKKIISFSGTKGFYLVLEHHIPDFGKYFLKNMQPKARINSLRQNKAKWADNQQRINKWITGL